jgi:hypothetical protein
VKPPGEVSKPGLTRRFGAAWEVEALTNNAAAATALQPITLWNIFILVRGFVFILDLLLNQTVCCV